MYHESTNHELPNPMLNELWNIVHDTEHIISETQRQIEVKQDDKDQKQHEVQLQLSIGLPLVMLLFNIFDMHVLSGLIALVGSAIIFGLVILCDIVPVLREIDTLTIEIQNLEQMQQRLFQRKVTVINLLAQYDLALLIELSSNKGLDLPSRKLCRRCMATKRQLKSILEQI